MDDSNAAELYRKHRPKGFKGIVGQDEAVGVLTQFLAKKDVPHALLFTGPSGCGKTTLARVLRKKMGCADPDFFEINAADFRGIDTVRELRARAAYKGFHSGVRVWLIDEAQQCSRDAQSALLKLLEDAPGHAYYMLATTDPQKLLATVRTRCTEVKVRPLTPTEVGVVLADVAGKEGLTLTPAVVDRIVEVADGSARKALVLLHQVAGLADEAAQLDAVLRSDGRRQAIELARCLMEKKGTWLKVAATLKGLADEDPEGLRRLVLAYANSVLLGGGPLAPRAYALIDVFAGHVYDSGKAGLAARCYEVFGQK